MLPSFIANLFWAEEEQNADGCDNTAECVAVEHTANEEVDDWLLITTHSPISSQDHNSNLHSECDVDSVCSDSSWVITPELTFQSANDSPPPSDDTTEDLLIEHPTMSVYQCHNNWDNLNEHVDSPSVTNNTQSPDLPNGTTTSGRGNGNNLSRTTSRDELQLARNRARELAREQSRQRRQLALYMQIPSAPVRVSTRLDSGTNKIPKLTRGALKRHNANSPQHNKAVGKPYQKSRIQKSTFKAGRRRC